MILASQGKTITITLCFAFLAANAYAQPIKSPKKETEIKTELKKSLISSTDTMKESFFGKMLSHLVIPLKRGPIIPLPTIDAGKDLGISYGIMPIWALRDPEKKGVSAVIIPSFDYNNYLGHTAAYRHYLFPNDETLIVMRGIYSQKIERDICLNYYTSEFLGARAKFNWEFWHWIGGKASFYGYGQGSRKSNRANYALHHTGEEFTITAPLYKNLFFSFTHKYFIRKVSDGPVGTNLTLHDYFPAANYAELERDKKFHTNKISFMYYDVYHPILPKVGTNVNLSILYSHKAFGSDYNYRTYSLGVKHYYNYKEEGKFVTAIRYLYQFQRGDDLPFYQQLTLGESAGLRMAGDGRFVDRKKFNLIFEERITFSKKPFLDFLSEMEIAPFLDMGTVFAKSTKLDFSKMRYGPGLALRLVIRPQVVVTVDLAFGSEGTNTILKVGYPF